MSKAFKLSKTFHDKERHLFARVRVDTEDELSVLRLNVLRGLRHAESTCIMLISLVYPDANELQ